MSTWSPAALRLSRDLDSHGFYFSRRIDNQWYFSRDDLRIVWSQGSAWVHIYRVGTALRAKRSLIALSNLGEGIRDAVRDLVQPKTECKYMNEWNEWWKNKYGKVHRDTDWHDHPPNKFYAEK